jgi:hypothetical protein
MKVLMKNAGRSLLNRERSEDITRICKVEETSTWVKRRKSEWNDIKRMTENRIVRIARDKYPMGRRRIGRQQKRWNDNLKAQNEAETKKKHAD